MAISMNDGRPNIMRDEDRVIGPPPDRSVYVITTANRKIQQPPRVRAAVIDTTPRTRRGKK